MPLEIVRNDITKISVDAIVNAANNKLLGGGGVDGAIHDAAGPGLLAECRALGGCATGDAKLTRAYNLPCKYVIHTVGPVWRGGDHGEATLLADCYQKSLALAQAQGCQSVAIPLISAGSYGYPQELALRTAVGAIRSFLEGHDMRVYLVVYDRESFRISESLFTGVARYIDDHYVAAHSSPRRSANSAPASDPKTESRPLKPRIKRIFGRSTERSDDAAASARPNAPRPLDDLLQQLDESFSQMVLRKITERGMTDAACYKRANLDRKLFSKIRSDIHYKPSKRTALALAIALELPLPELSDLLMKAGFALSHSTKFDVIIEYFVQQGKYDIDLINETLFYFDQQLLGG